MLWAAIFQAIAQGLTNAFSTWNYLKENKQQSKELAQQAQEQADQRAKKAKYDMQQQKTSFLKSGIYFNSGSPLDVIGETYDVAKEDINALNRDSLTAQKKLRRAGKTAFFSFFIDPVNNNGGQIASNIYQGIQARNATKASSASSSSGTLMSGSPASSKMTNTKIS